ALIWPLMTVSSLGAQRESWLHTCVSALWAQGFASLAALVAAFSIVLPIAYLTALVVVLSVLRLELPIRIGGLFRWVQRLRPWMMIEVYLVGGFVAYSRIKVVSTIQIEIGGWCLLAASLLFLFALTQLDERTVWEALPVKPDARRGSRTIACTVCDLIVTDSEE